MTIGNIKQKKDPHDEGLFDKYFEGF